MLEEMQNMLISVKCCAIGDVPIVLNESHFRHAVRVFGACSMT